jgi:hypothetical protein
VATARRSSLSGSHWLRVPKFFVPGLETDFLFPRWFFRRGLVIGTGQMTSLDC